MGSGHPIVMTLARQVLAKFPKASTRGLAGKLVKDYPEVFHSHEQARSAVRAHRGEHGNNNAKCLGTRTKAERKNAASWAKLLPEPVATGWKWHELPENVRRWLILSDLHIPFHDLGFLTAALSHANGNCDGILLLGDVMDCYQLSNFCRDPRAHTIGKEIDDTKRFLDAVAKLRGIKATVWKGGNHELRVERYVWQHAAQLADAPGLTLQTWLELDKRGIPWIPCQEPIRHHQLAILHGHEQGNRFSSPVNPARGLFLRMIECCIAGHEHRSSSHTERTLLGTTIGTWSVGCGCDLHPLYKPLGHKWNHGFAYLKTGTEWEIENWKILDGKPKLC